MDDVESVLAYATLLLIVVVFIALSFCNVSSCNKLKAENLEMSKQLQTIKSELAYHEKYLQALDANATRDRTKNKQTKETVDFIYNGLGGDRYLGGE